MNTTPPKFVSSKMATIIAVMAMMVASVPVHAQEPNSLQQPDAELERLRQSTIKKGLEFLAKSGQAENGSFTERAGAGITALAITAAVRNGKSIDDPMVAKGLKALEAFVKPDGGIYGGGRLKNYETCVAMVAFAESNSAGKYNQVLKDASDFIKGLQTGDNPRKSEDPWYGGVGYGGAGRPDLSNTAYFVEALTAAGAEENDAAIQRAIVFIARCQNLKGPGNDTRFANLVDDGGFYYSIPTGAVEPGKDPERFTPQGGLRSYGSMTYSGLKSMIYAGLDEKDPRVKAAIKWIGNSYSVDSNPGMGNAGLFYYYHTFGAALGAAGMDEIVDANGKKQDWRKDLIRELASQQQENGSWENSNSRWFENDANLATSFALMALSYCNPKPAPSK